MIRGYGKGNQFVTAYCCAEQGLVLVCFASIECRIRWNLHLFGAVFGEKCIFKVQNFEKNAFFWCSFL